MVHYPTPRRLKSDNASYYTSNEIKGFCETVNLKLQGSIPYTPITNSKAERPNQWLGASIKAAISETGRIKNIHSKVKNIMKAWNRSPNPTLGGHSPFIMYGQEHKLLSQKFDIPQTQEVRTEEIKAIQEIRKTLPKILRDNYEGYKEQHNEGRIQLGCIHSL